MSIFLRGKLRDDAELRRIWPRCHQCRVPVERLERVRDPLHLVTVFRAHCHGQVEETVLTDALAGSTADVTAGVAFRPQELQEAPERLP